MEGEKKPNLEEMDGDDEDKDKIQIRIRSNDGTELRFRMKRTVRLGKMFASYATKKGHPRAAVRFMFDGDRVQDEDTPSTLEMEDDDCIDCFVEQTGGSA